MEYSGAWEKLIHENRKSRDTVPLSILKSFFYIFLLEDPCCYTL